MKPLLELDPEPDGPDPEESDVLRTIRRVNLLELKPASLMLVSVAFGPEDPVCRALVDSGSSDNLILENHVRDLGLSVEPSKASLKGLGSGLRPVLGVVYLSPVLHGRTFKPTKFFVVPAGVIFEPVVLGYQFMRDNNIVLDCANNKLSINDLETGTLWEVYMTEQGAPCQQVWYGVTLIAAKSIRVSQTEPVRIPATLSFPGEVNPVFECPDCSKEHPEYFYDGLVTESGLSDKISGIPGILEVRGNQSRVLVQSCADKPVLIKEGDVLGRVYTMVSVDSPPESDKSAAAEQIVEAISSLPLASDLTNEQAEEFRSMLQSHLPVISTGDDDVGACRTTPIRIQLYDETPIYQRVRRFSPPVTEAIEEQCKELHDLGIIEPSMSPWSAPVVPVSKPDKTIRLCIDYRQLNKVTVPDRFPMPNLTDSVFSLHGIKYFTSLDLVRGYYQLPLSEDSKELTAFSTAYGHWQFRRLSFGLKNAPAVFQREMQRILQEFPKAKVIVYIDDILILGSSFEEHLALVHRVLTVLHEQGLKIKLSKCSWVQAEVKYLGHLVGRTGMRKLPEYIQKIDGFPKPATVKELRSFLGFVNFQRKFVPHCSTIAKPLSRVTGGRKRQGNRKLEWTDEMETAYVKLKEKIKEDILLSFPDYSPDAKPLELFVDASGEGAGACLCQIQDGECKIIAFDSMTFLPCETRYSTIERELAALRWGVKTFRSFLFGQYFVIHSDHRPLMYLHDMKMIDGRLSRTLEELSEFDFTVKYCPGSQNFAADWLSRMSGPVSQNLSVDDSFTRLPAGLHIYEEVKGGPSSLIEALQITLKLLYEGQGKDGGSVPNEADLRQQIVQQFLKDFVRLGFTLDKSAKNRIKSMMYPGTVPALELLLSVSKCFNVEVWVHFGPTCPVVYRDPTVEDTRRIHLQCLGGVHFNPVIELRHFAEPTDVVSGVKFSYEKPKEESNHLEELDEPIEFEVMYSQEVEETPCAQPICNHLTENSARCVISCNGTPCCSLVDTGAQVSIVAETVLSTLGITFTPTLSTDIETLEGVTGKSIVLGEVMLSLEFPGGFCSPMFPFAVISSEDLEFCFLLGRNFLKETELLLDFSCGLLVKDHQQIARIASTCSKETNVTDSSCTSVLMVMGTNSSYGPDVEGLITFDQLREIQRNHGQLQRIKKLVAAGTPVCRLPRSLKQFRRVWSDFVVEDNLLFKNDRNGGTVMVIPFSVLVDLVIKIHLENSHIGVYKMTNMVRRVVWHQSLSKVIKDVCCTCQICQTCKVSGQVVVPPTLKITTSSPFDLVAMDVISLPLTSTRYVGCLMMVDHYTKWVIAVPIRNKKSQTIARALEINILPNIPRVPVRILTDNGPEFVSKEFVTSLERHNIVHVRSTPYKPSSNGAVERVNRTISELLRILTDEPRKWDELLPKALLTYNHTVHSETGCTPAEMILRKSHDIDSLPLLSAEIRNPWAEGHPRYKPFSVGSLVLKKTVLLGHLTTNKLMPRFDGPYRIDKVNANKITYDLTNLESGNSVKAHHVQLKLWYEAPSYITKHLQFYPLDLEGSLSNDNAPVESAVPPVIREDISTSSGSEEEYSDIPLEILAKVLSTDHDERRREVKSNVRREVRPTKSILKTPQTYERKRALKLWEDSVCGVDSRPSLTPDSVYNESNLVEDSSDTELDGNSLLAEPEMFNLPSPDLSESSFDGNEVPNQVIDTVSVCDVSVEAPQLTDRGNGVRSPSMSPFRNSDGTIKAREQLVVEVELLQDIYGNDYEAIAETLWGQSLLSLFDTGAVSGDFSGFEPGEICCSSESIVTTITHLPLMHEEEELSDISSSDKLGSSLSPVVFIPDRQPLSFSDIDSLSNLNALVPLLPMEASETGHVLTRKMLDWEMDSIHLSNDQMEIISEESHESVNCGVCEQVVGLVTSLDSLCMTGMQRLYEEVSAIELVSSEERRSISGFSSRYWSSFFRETLNVQSFSGFSNLKRSHSTPELVSESYKTFSPVTPPPPVSVSDTPVSQTPIITAGALFRDLRESISEIRDVLKANRRASCDRLRRVLIDSPLGASESGSSCHSPIVRYNLSPPYLRSRGRTIDLPRVMDKPIEYFPHQH